MEEERIGSVKGKWKRKKQKKKQKKKKSFFLGSSLLEKKNFDFFFSLTPEWLCFLVLEVLKPGINISEDKKENIHVILFLYFFFYFFFFFWFLLGGCVSS